MIAQFLPKNLRRYYAKKYYGALVADLKLQKFLFEGIKTNHDESNNASDCLKFIARCIHQADESASQLFQDLWVLEELKEKRNGFFVEFGATDGIRFSNSYLLEKKYGWTGILAEPNPTWHDQLFANRKCMISTKCIFSESDKTISFSAAKNPELAGIKDFLRKRIERKMRLHDIELQTISLNDLLLSHNAPKEIDFISIDTEGSEFDILSKFDFDRWHVKLFCIEHNNSIMKSKIVKLLESHNYELKYPDLSDFDAWFIKK